MVRPNDRHTKFNKQTNRQANHWPSILPIDLDQQANQPSDRLAINPTTDYRSIHPTERRPTNQRQFLQTTIAWIPGIRIRQSPQFCQAGCIAVSTSIQATYKRTPTSPLDLHFSVWPSSAWTHFPITKFLRRGTWPMPASHWSSLRHCLPILYPLGV